jgi:hypothetical protein
MTKAFHKARWRLSPWPLAGRIRAANGWAAATLSKTEQYGSYCSGILFLRQLRDVLQGMLWILNIFGLFHYFSRIHIGPMITARDRDELFRSGQHSSA